MTRKQEQLQARGFISDEIEFDPISLDEIIKLLRSNVPSERTLGARLLSDHKTKESVDYLINALRGERKLYSKIEMCNSLVELSELSIHPLIICLGTVGNNQHKVVPEKEFLKDSYPLPRDIVARTLVRIGKRSIPELCSLLETKNVSVLSEVIDAIGHINFYASIENIYHPLKSCYIRNRSEDLIKWKLIRAFSGIDESEGFLIELLATTENDRLKSEIERSLRLIIKRQY
jgi:HEAT repeat protein